ncbi:hypothetical protein DUNSADRAFT_8470 [Dunaliella salina]|uniref:N-acetyltransferase domain-containing protein n=1 Tax=Dunaliella salina TaxID=3046 RepID=A0ABQ7GJJ5_DUNSA|nr:hypothetical protein DUNSADRAFT_8470 [Dunaliella salina]|eukprot:KAF5834743.1 hypothetical protein DUNSADRAFT_8470 [Dunaliella salina]
MVILNRKHTLHGAPMPCMSRLPHPRIRAKPVFTPQTHGTRRVCASSPTQQPLIASTPEGVHMRQATQEDMPFIRKAILREWMNPLGHEPSRFCVAASKGGDGREEIIGFGQMELKSQGAQGPGRQWELRSLIVERQHRKKGVGTALVETLKSRCSQGDAAYLVTLAVTQDFYKRLGFHVVAKPPAWLAPEAALGQVVSRLAGYTDGLVVMCWER